MPAMRIRRRRQHASEFKRRTAPGAAPGQVVSVPNAPRPKLTAFVYNAGSVRELTLDSPAEIRPLRDGEHVIWINVDGVGDAATVQQVAEVFHLHPLAQED